MSLTINNNSEIQALDQKRSELIKDVYCKGLSDDEVKIFSYVCTKTGLDPVAKQIHPVKRWDSSLGRETMTIQTGIDGYRLIADRTGNYCPGRKPTFEYDQHGKLISATAYVKKLTKDGNWHEISESALYNEYVGLKKDGKPNSMWMSKPHIMLAKCAEALALRRAFPAELSGIYTKEEMEQADNPIEIIPLSEKKINKDQVEELTNVMSKCDPEYKQKAWKFWKNEFKINSIEDLPASEYESILRGALYHIQEKAKKISEEQAEEIKVPKEELF